MEDAANISSILINATLALNGTNSPLVNATVLHNEKIAKNLIESLIWLPNMLIEYIFYMFWLLVLVESKDGAAQVPRDSKKADSVQLSTFAGMEEEREMLQVQRQPSHKPLTSSIGNTIQYLYYSAGIFGLYRGFHIWLLGGRLNWAVRALFKSCFGALDVDSKYKKSLLTIFITVMAIPLDLMWVWSVIGRTNSSRRFPTRLPTTMAGLSQLLHAIPLPPFPSRSDMLQFLSPVLQQAILMELSNNFWPSKSLIRTYFLDPFLEQSRASADQQDFSQHKRMLILGGLATVEKLVRGIIWLVIENSDTLVNIVAATLLPESVETIVRFDRTCRGKINHIPGRAITLLQAFRFLDIAKFWRLGKMCLLTGGLVMAITGVCTVAVRSTLDLELLPNNNATFHV